MDPRLLIVYRVPGYKAGLHMDPVIERFKALGMRVEAIHINDVVPFFDGEKVVPVNGKGWELTDFDLVFFYGVLGFDGNRLRPFEQCGVRVLNSPDAIELVADKHKCAVALGAKGIPFPAHLLLSSSKESREVSARKLGSRMITKPVDGSLGTNVSFVPNKSILDRMNIGSRYIAQEYIKEAALGDVRVFVVGGKVIASMRRVPARGEYRANLSRGGTGSVYDLSAAEERLCLKAVELCGLDFAGVDFVPTKGGPVFIEVNARPGYKIAQVCGVDVGQAVRQHIVDVARAEMLRRVNNA
jgi:ribosomal protein S6--L-glutamate ligase